MIVQYIRSALFAFIALPIWTLIICIFGSPFLLMPRTTFMKLIHLWADGVAWLEAVILNLRYEVRGIEHLPADQHCIVASKHQSTYETFKIHNLFKDSAIILKKELFRVPLWGQYLMKTGAIAIDRSTPEKAIVSVRDGAIKVANEKRTIVIYPQGTRVTPETTPKDVSYKPGVFRIHEATGLPVVPLATNSGCFWPKGSLLKRPGTVVFEFLPALPAGLSRKDMMAHLQDTIEERSNALAEEVRNKAPY